MTTSSESARSAIAFSETGLILALREEAAKASGELRALLDEAAARLARSQSERTCTWPRCGYQSGGPGVAGTKCWPDCRPGIASSTAPSYMPGLKLAQEILRKNGFEKSALAVGVQIAHLEAQPALDTPSAIRRSDGDRIDDHSLMLELCHQLGAMNGDNMHAMLFDAVRDASRYRHLRSHWGDFTGYDSKEPGRWLDDTIDAALQQAATDRTADHG